MKSIILLLILLGTPAQAHSGLTIYAGEIGIGKFHRKDNTVHPYGAGNAWIPYILPNGISKTPFVQKNKDGSFTIFYSHLDELLSTVEKVAGQQKLPVSILNVHAHGLPGGMWFPTDANSLNSDGCKDWRDSASAADEVNYNQYYSAVPKNEIIQIRKLSTQTTFHAPCTATLGEWQSVLAKHPNLKSVLADNLQVHFLSCVVGLGKLGDNFTQGIAALLLKSDAGRVQTALKFGLGDWSMVEGMGFWDYETDAQLDRDNTNYPIHRQDREEMQKGGIRIAGLLNSKLVSSILPNQDFIFMDDKMPGTLADGPHQNWEAAFKAGVKDVRIPGTRAHVQVSE